MKLTVGIGLLGCGTVGSHVADRLLRERDAIERSTRVRYELRAIAILDSHKRRPDSLDRRLLTSDARCVVDDPDVDLVIEVIGGEAVAGELVERALHRGCHVVTANKDLLATQGPRLQKLAALCGAALRFEAAVGGAIPILRTLSDALAGDEVLAVAGVVNGTCTSILSAMEQGVDFHQALSTAQRLGYAEADPSSDVDGTDAAHKLALLCQVAFGVAVISPRIRRTGIAAVTRGDVAQAQMSGLRIRLIAATFRAERGVSAEAAPVLVSEAHEFGRTSGVDNVIQVVTRGAGRLVLRGPGAGGAATASAVIGDVVNILRAIGGRRELSFRRDSWLEPVIEVEPFFSDFARAPELPDYPIWDDAMTNFAELPRLVSA